MSVIENYDSIKEKVLVLLNQEETDKLNIQIEGILIELLAYCYRDEVPEFAENAFAEVIATEITKKQTVICEGVTSYKEGDLTLSFGGDTTSTGVRYNGKLEGFKKIRGLTA